MYRSLSQLAVLAIAVTLAGCASGVRLEAEHVSHPFAGRPFSDRTEEDSLTQVNALLEWQRHGWFIESGLGYRVRDGGFYGPPLTFTVRAGRRFELK
jgi:hypothetical protein